MIQLLVVDDDAEIRVFVAAVAEGLGFAVHEAESFVALCAQLDRQSFDGIVLDLSLKDADGIEALRFLASRNFRAPIIIASGFDDRLLTTARRLGESYGLAMAGQIRKPFPPRELRDLLSTLSAQPKSIDVEDLREALRLGHLGLAYQPKVDLDSGQLLGAEALARWYDPVRGTIGPDKFIDLAEKNGLMAPMMDLILDRAAADCAAWAKQGISAPVAVNLSAGLLTDLTVPDRIASQVKAAGLDPSSVILEVTESTAMEDPTTSMDVLTRLRIKGFKLSLDDFGTGYSSLVELHRMPFSELKIDRSFVTPIDNDRDARVIVRAIIGLGQALGLTIVAEGVETEGQRQVLREHGCRVGQGYLFSKPLPYADFVRWAHANKGDRAAAQDQAVTVSA